MSDNALIDKIMSERKNNAARFFNKYDETDAIRKLSNRILEYLSEDQEVKVCDDNTPNSDDPELTLD